MSACGCASGDGAMLNAIAFRAAGQPLGQALLDEPRPAGACRRHAVDRPLERRRARAVAVDATWRRWICSLRSRSSGCQAGVLGDAGQHSRRRFRLCRGMRKRSPAIQVVASGLVRPCLSLDASSPVRSRAARTAARLSPQAMKSRASKTAASLTRQTVRPLSNRSAITPKRQRFDLGVGPRLRSTP